VREPERERERKEREEGGEVKRKKEGSR